jgi:peptidoglycan hydrolase-like protein with peptidoglycan-binding domain
MNYKNYIGIAMIAVLVIAGVAGYSLNARAAQFPLLSTERDLTVGSTGLEVIELQGVLSELGYLNVPIHVPFGYFGQMTKVAVAQYQTSVGVNSTGYFGPLTRTAMRNSFNTRGWLSLLYSSVTL